MAALDEVPVGALMPLAAFGRDLAVGSAPGGRALVTDSVCPHLGADLAAGGRIDDGQVVCPLHEWCFSHAGACVSSGSEPLPAAISLRVWPTEVVGGTVLAFNGRDGEVPAAGQPDLASGGGGEDRVGGQVKGGLCARFQAAVNENDWCSVGRSRLVVRIAVEAGYSNRGESGAAFALLRLDCIKKFRQQDGRCVGKIAVTREKSHVGGVDVHQPGNQQILGGRQKGQAAG